MIRALTDNEKCFIRGVAARLESEARNRLINDLALAQVEAELADGELIRFCLDGYEYPHRGGQGLYPVEGELSDEDGSLISLLLFTDPADRLYELEYLRWGDGPLQRPNWSTLKFVPDVIPTDNSAP